VLSNHDDIDPALASYNAVRQPLSQRIVSHGRKLGTQLGVGIETDEDRRLSKLLQTPKGIMVSFTHNFRSAYRFHTLITNDRADA
jgi:hypothetical protein